MTLYTRAVSEDGLSGKAVFERFRVSVTFPRCLPLFCRYGDVLTDADGLPLVYDSDSIGRYWDKRPGEVGAWVDGVDWRTTRRTLVVGSPSTIHISPPDAT